MPRLAILRLTCLVVFCSTVAQGFHHQQPSSMKVQDEKAFRRTGEDKPDSLFSTMTKVGSLMKDTLATVDTSTAVTMSITNNNNNCELTEPKWYILKGTKLDTPPEFKLRKDETMIMTMAGTVGPALKFWKSNFGSKGFMSFKFGAKKWLLVAWDVVLVFANKFYAEIKESDPFPTGNREDFFKNLMETNQNVKTADQYGTWYVDTKGDKKIFYSMGGANKAPFQIFVA